VKLLFERLVAFRTTVGRVGLLAEPCSHLDVSLLFGDVGADGIRCFAHGWEFDLQGDWVSIYGEPINPAWRDWAGQKAYPCQELGGIIWTYMGARSAPPALPPFPWSALPPSQVQVSRHPLIGNYLDLLDDELAAQRRVELRRLIDPDDALLDDPDELQRLLQSVRIPSRELVPVDPARAHRAEIWVPMDDANTQHWTIVWHPSRPLREGELDR
jgi:nitrite reductase/ring-hydroxylating ferredoxin subunit